MVGCWWFVVDNQEWNVGCMCVVAFSMVPSCLLLLSFLVAVFLENGGGNAKYDNERSGQNGFKFQN